MSGGSREDGLEGDRRKEERMCVRGWRGEGRREKEEEEKEDGLG